jgi:DNA-binding NarL/FixJ family response regulator
VRQKAITDLLEAAIVERDMEQVKRLMPIVMNGLDIEAENDWHAYFRRVLTERDEAVLSSLRTYLHRSRGGHEVRPGSRLQWTAPGGGLLVHHLADTPISCSIGRELGRDVVLWMPNVSRRHAAITSSGVDWWIEDTRSTNGTLLRRRPDIMIRVLPQHREMLRDGDQILLGGAVIHFFDPDEVARTTSPLLDGIDWITPRDDENAPRLGFLTGRESEVLSLLCQPRFDGGNWATNNDIANVLFISIDTVRSHMKALYAKFEVPDEGLTQEQKRDQLVRRAIAGGWAWPLRVARQSRTDTGELPTTQQPPPVD